MIQTTSPKRQARTASLSVVVIGLNEAENLERCISSVRQSIIAARSIADSEIIYIDSQSTDNSMEIAGRYADLCFELEGKRSAGAARSRGLEMAKFEIVLFLDGDMELHPAWLQRAIPILLAQRPSVAGITGIRDDHYVDASGKVTATRPNVYRVRDARRAPHFGGALLAWRQAIRTVGGYQGFLAASEEPDLHARLLANKLHVVELPIPFIRHFTPPPQPALNRLLNLLRLRGPMYSFGISFWCAVRYGYLRGFQRVFKATSLVWMADLLSLLALVLGVASVAGALQAILLVGLMLTKKSKEFALARLRFYGVSVSGFFLIGRVLTVRLRRGDANRRLV